MRKKYKEMVAEEKYRAKMYKKKGRWVVAGLTTVFFLTGAIGIGSTSHTVTAAEGTTTSAPQQVTTNTVAGTSGGTTETTDSAVVVDESNLANTAESSETGTSVETEKTIETVQTPVAESNDAVAEDAQKTEVDTANANTDEPAPESDLTTVSETQAGTPDEKNNNNPSVKSMDEKTTPETTNGTEVTETEDIAKGSPNTRTTEDDVTAYQNARETYNNTKSTVQSDVDAYNTRLNAYNVKLDAYKTSFNALGDAPAQADIDALQTTYTTLMSEYDQLVEDAKKLNVTIGGENVSAPNSTDFVALQAMYDSLPDKIKSAGSTISQYNDGVEVTAETLATNIIAAADKAGTESN